jgi:hypothetical protein
VRRRGAPKKLYHRVGRAVGTFIGRAARKPASKARAVCTKGSRGGGALAGRWCLARFRWRASGGLRAMALVDGCQFQSAARSGYQPARTLDLPWAAGGQFSLDYLITGLSYW